MKQITFIFLLILASIITVQSQNFEVPKNYKFEKREDYKPYEPQIKEAINWSLNTPLDVTPDKRKEVYAFIMVWLTGTPDVNLNINVDEFNFWKINKDLLFPFMLGLVKYSLDNDYSTNEIQGYKFAIETTVAFYKNNIKVLKKDEELEKYGKLISEGKLEEELKKKLNK